MDSVVIKDNERIDDLYVNDLKIIQNPKGFCFGIDAILLSNFARVKKDATVVDLGTGTGVIPLVIAGKSRAAHVHGLEIQEEVADMAQRSVALNGLEGRVTIHNLDMNQVLSIFPKEVADVVTSNPPYMPVGKALQNPGSKKAISRHEITVTLDDVVRTAKELLKIHGQFFMIHRPTRLVDIITTCRKYKLEPKRIQFVHPKEGKEPTMVMVHCVRGGKPEVRVMEPLFVYQDNGQLTDQIQALYDQETIEPKAGGGN